MNDKLKAFYDKEPASNSEWAAQQIIRVFKGRGYQKLKDTLESLDKALYKSWAKELTLKELLKVVELIDSLKE